MATGRVCAGRPGPGGNKQDCAEVARRLNNNSNYTNVVTTGVGTTDSDRADYYNGRYNSFMYWSGHGDVNKNGLLLSNQGDFDMFNQMGRWGTGDSLTVLMVAACYVLHQNVWGRWVTVFKNSNLRIVASYGLSAPVGSDTQIASNYFTRLNNGQCVRDAWKGANQNYASSSWGILSYGNTDANKLYKMPGWGSNSGATRSGSVYLVRQSGNQALNSSLPAASVHETPIAMTTDEPVLTMNTGVYGEGVITRFDGVECVDYRKEVDAEISTESAKKVSIASIQTLVGADVLNDALIIDAPITMGELTDAGELIDERVIGMDTIIVKQSNGVPLYDSFIRICADADGVYRVVNKWIGTAT